MSRPARPPDRARMRGGPAGAASFGLVGFGHVLGEPTDVSSAAARYTADLKKIRSWGYRRFHRAPDGVGLTELAARAGQQALAHAGRAAEDVDLVVLAISDIAEYLYWDPAAATQARLGAHRAEAVLVNQACASGVMSFDTVAGKFATHPGYQTALIIAANRVCEAYWNRMDSSAAISSDGAAAAVAVRGHGRCRWLATEIISDGRLADLARMELGGAARPFAGQRSLGHIESPFDRMADYFGSDVKRMLNFVQTFGARSREVFRSACRQADVRPAQVKRVIHLNDNLQAFADLASDLGISVQQLNADLAMELGHVGCADQILCLELHLRNGDLSPGDVIALTSTGNGMHWSCTLLRI